MHIAYFLCDYRNFTENFENCQSDLNESDRFLGDSAKDLLKLSIKHANGQKLVFWA